MCDRILLFLEVPETYGNYLREVLGVGIGDEWCLVERGSRHRCVDCVLFEGNCEFQVVRTFADLEIF